MKGIIPSLTILLLLPNAVSAQACTETASLLFHSGFESGVSITGQDTRQPNIIGSDQGYDWQQDMPGGENNFYNLLLQTCTYNDVSPEHMTIEIIPSDGGVAPYSGSRMLHHEKPGSGKLCGGDASARIQYNFYSDSEFDWYKAYVEYYMYIPQSAIDTLETQDSWWWCFHEWRGVHGGIGNEQHAKLYIRKTTTGSPVWSLWDDNGFRNSVPFDSSYTDRWMKIGIFWDRSSEVRLYVDDELLIQRSASWDTHSVSNYFAKVYGTAGQDAYFDDLRIYDDLPSCSTTECSDSLDNDNDGQTDLSDPGCSSPTDNDETNCGDGACEGGETCSGCEDDCGACQNCSEQGGFCCTDTQTCPGTDLGTTSDCPGTCCSDSCHSPPADTCTDLGYHCCFACEPGTEHPENDTDCPVVCCGECLSHPPGEYNYSIIKTPYPLVIDADPSEFSDADTITVQGPATGTTGTYRLMWDTRALYIAAQFSDSAINALNTENDTGLWGDDSLEIMFDTLFDRGGSIRSDDYKFFASSAGVYSDSQAYDMDWNTQVIYAVSVDGTVNDNSDTDTGYVIEMAIPWQDWGIDEPVFSSVWGMNIALNDRPDATTHPTQTQWSESGLSVNVPDGWNDVLFTVRTDTSRDGCIEEHELIPFIDLWRYDSTANPMWEVMEAVTLWSRGTGCT